MSLNFSDWDQCDIGEKKVAFVKKDKKTYVPLLDSTKKVDRIVSAEIVQAVLAYIRVHHADFGEITALHPDHPTDLRVGFTVTFLGHVESAFQSYLNYEDKLVSSLIECSGLSKLVSDDINTTPDPSQINLTPIAIIKTDDNDAVVKRLDQMRTAIDKAIFPPEFATTFHSLFFLSTEVVELDLGQDFGGRSCHKYQAEISLPSTSLEVYGVVGSSKGFRPKKSWIADYRQAFQHKYGYNPSTFLTDPRNINTKPLQCSIQGCSSPAVHGAHVHKRQELNDNFQFIIPTCAAHNHPTTNGPQQEDKKRMYTKIGTVFMKIPPLISVEELPVSWQTRKDYDGLSGLLAIFSDDTPLLIEVIENLITMSNTEFKSRTRNLNFIKWTLSNSPGSLDSAQLHALVSSSEAELLKSQDYCDYRRLLLKSVIGSCSTNFSEWGKSTDHLGIEWKFPRLKKSVYWNPQPYYNLLDTLYPRDEASGAAHQLHSHPNHPSITKDSRPLFPSKLQYHLNDESIPPLSSNLKLFFSTPHIANGEWIQFHGPGTRLFDDDVGGSGFHLVVGGLCPKGKEGNFQFRCSYSGSTYTAKYEISIKWK